MFIDLKEIIKTSNDGKYATFNMKMMDVNSRYETD